VEVLIKYLQRDKGLLVIEKEVIKFVDESDEKESVVTAVDHGVLDMKNAASRLEAQIEEIQRKIDQ
jgi:charged multivesicular body protein 7